MITGLALNLQTVYADRLEGVLQLRAAGELMVDAPDYLF